MGSEQAENIGFDCYCDTIMVTTGPGSTHVSFLVQPPHPAVQPGAEAHVVGTMRMSTENAKVFVTVMLRQIKEMERTNNCEVSLPLTTLNRLGVAPEDWQTIWGQH